MDEPPPPKIARTSSSQNSVSTRTRSRGQQNSQETRPSTSGASGALPRSTSTTMENGNVGINGGRKSGGLLKMMDILEKQDLVVNFEPFTCPVCSSNMKCGTGITLRNCLHSYCKDCLSWVIQSVKEPDLNNIKCPYSDDGYSCLSLLQEREIRALLPPDIFETILLNSIKDSDNSICIMETMKLIDQEDLVISSEIFTCTLCSKNVQIGDGIVLRDCLHPFCRPCLSISIRNSDQADIKCPFPEYVCSGSIQEREIKAILPRDMFEKYLANSINLTEGSVKVKSYHCVTPNCEGWCLFDESVDFFVCPICDRRQAVSSKGEYLEMQELVETGGTVPNTDEFECPICFSNIPPEEGCMLRECLHTFCKDCLSSTIEHSEEVYVKCPYQDNNYSCQSHIQDREIKALITPQLLDKHIAKSVRLAETQIPNSYHCKTPNCDGWCIYEDNVNFFECPACMKQNCLTCRAVHEGMNCKEYQKEVEIAAETDPDAKKTRIMMLEMLKKGKEKNLKKDIRFYMCLNFEGEAMECPNQNCKVLIMKKAGCDFILCSICKIGICWVTKQARWGPKGPGDWTGGCKCRVGGKLCHPKCGNCH